MARMVRRMWLYLQAIRQGALRETRIRRTPVWSPRARSPGAGVGLTRHCRRPRIATTPGRVGLGLECK
jgi:hypothetical protein